MNGKQRPQSSTKKSAKEKRLAEALKRNIARRKAAAKLDKSEKN